MLEEEIAKRLPLEKLYDDLFAPVARETGDIAKNVVKAARCILMPIDYLAAMQDRLQRWMKKVADKVSEENLIDAVPQMSGPIFEGLRYLDGGLLEEMFLNLLARAIDKDRVNEAHPAFPRIIAQLSPDEAMVLVLLKGRSGAYGIEQTADFDASTNLFAASRLVKNTFPLDKLIYPQHFFLYMDHLHSLNLAGIWQDGNQEPIVANGRQTGTRIKSKVRVTDFGELFIKACVPDADQLV